MWRNMQGKSASKWFSNSSSNVTAGCNVELSSYASCYYGTQTQQYQHGLNYQPRRYYYSHRNQPTAPYRQSLTNNYNGDSNVCSYLVNTSAIQSEVVLLRQEGVKVKSNPYDGFKMTEQEFKVPNNTDFMPNTTNLTGMNGTSNYYQPNMDQRNKSVFESLADADRETITFIIDTCMTAESIADRNQYRPFFKDIHSFCSKTMLNILKPRNTVEIIHSYGIPWVTKDFICAFMRLVNTWDTLKGYLDEPNENLGKIESVLTPELRKCYRDWEHLNKKMFRHLANVFVNLDLDNGMSEDNATIYSSFNDTFIPITSAENLQNLSNFNGILRLGEIFSSENDSNSFDSVHIAQDYIENQQYTHSGTFLQTIETKSQIKHVTYKTTTSNIDSNVSEHDLRDSESLTQTRKCVWPNGAEKIIPLIENEMDKYKTKINTYTSNNNDASCNDILAAENTYDTASDIHAKVEDCYNNEPMLHPQFASAKCKEPGLSASCKEKFENIINVLLELMFVKYFTAMAKCGQISENYKYINKPIYLYKIKELLTQNKYIQPEQIVHDIRSIINEAKYYNQYIKVLWVEKITTTFSSELDVQLFEKFSMSDFDYISGESPQFSLFTDHNILTGENTYDTDSKIFAKDLRQLSLTYYNYCNNNETKVDPVFASAKRKEAGLSASDKEKFENIISILLQFKFVKFFTDAAKGGRIAENYKYINKPIYLYKIKECLIQNKYTQPEQVVHDIRSIVNEAKYYNKDIKILWLEKITASFSSEVDVQLFEKFYTSDFDYIIGEMPQPSLFVRHNIHNASNGTLI